MLGKALLYTVVTQGPRQVEAQSSYHMLSPHEVLGFTVAGEERACPSSSVLPPGGGTHHFLSHFIGQKSKLNSHGLCQSVKGGV